MAGDYPTRNHRRRLDERAARALLLPRAGWDVDIYERVEQRALRPRRRHRGPTELIAQLAHPRPRRPTARRLRSPRARSSIAGGRLSPEIACPQVLTAWERVYRLLRDAFPAEHYRRGRGLDGFARRAEEVRRILPMAKQ